MPDQPTYLTETILTIQHEVQLALDYIETVTSQEASQLGAALSLVTIDTLRVRIPIVLEMEQAVRPMGPEQEQPAPGTRLSVDELAQFKSQLQSRQGLLLKEQKGRLGSFAKVRVTSPTSAVSATPSTGGATPSVQPLIGEIEMNFVRVPRELEKAAPPSVAASVGGAGGTPVPDLVGLTLDETTAQLKAVGWSFVPHAASDEEIMTAPRELRGRVLRQDPPAEQLVDKASVTLHFWVALSNLPVTEIDGIGEKLGKRLAELDIATAGQLSLSKAADIASSLRMNQQRVQGFIDMAALMSRLIILGLKDEVVELVVKGAGIHSIEELASANPAQLYDAFREAISAARVRVPRGFVFTRDDVAGWINAARDYLGR